MFCRCAAGARPPRPRVYDPKAALKSDLSLGVSLTPLVGCGDEEVLADAANGACSGIVARRRKRKKSFSCVE
jgi:hypothetical protein